MKTTFTLTSPESKGISSENIINFYRKLDEKNYPLHSALLYLNGALVSKTYCAPFKEGQLHRMFSIAKTMTALAVGILFDRGRLSPDDKIVDYFPEKLSTTPHPYLQQLTIREMLMMRTCYTKTSYNKFDLSSDWVGSFFTATPDKKSGTVFHYDTGAAHVLAALVEKLTETNLMNFLRQSLPELELSSESYMLTDGQGVSMGGSGYMATTEDLLKIGILLSQKGLYNGKQLISRQFVETATSNLTPTLFNGPIPSEACGYGYMIWQTEKEGFVCYGMGGQFIIAHPKKNLILVTTSDTQGYAGGNQILYDAFYENIYDNIVSKTPANSSCDELSDTSTCDRRPNALPENELPENPESLASLRSLEAVNSIKPIHRVLVGSTATSAQKLHDYRPVLELHCNIPDIPNDLISLTLHTDATGGTLTLNGDSITFTFPFGYENHVESTLEKYNAPQFGSAVWLDENTLYLHFRLLGENVGSIRIELVLSEQDLVLSMRKIEETLFTEFQGTYVCPISS